MILTLAVTGPGATTAATDRKVFHRTGGTIGRLPDNDWVLPDPYVSGRHALIRYADGVFSIEDTSTNGVFINSPDNRLRRGQSYAIQSGDRIIIEPFQIEASIADGSARADLGGAHPGAPADSSFLSGDEVDPLVLLGRGNDLSSGRGRSRAAELASGSVLNEPYEPPGSLIPDDYDPLRTDDRPLPRPAAAPASSAKTPALASVRKPVPERLPERPKPRDPSGGPGDIDLAAVLAGAGLDNVSVTPELARGFGQILRVVVAGIMDVLRARQQTKEEFRMSATRFKPADNNPLKFSANVDDALHNLLVKRNPAYLGPVEAFEDAFEDLRNHQMATLAGLRVAFDAMLSEFDPDRLQEQFDAEGKHASLLPLPGRLRYWSRYRDRFHQMHRDADASFKALFGDEFAKAYEDHLTRLKAEKRPRQR